MQPAILQEMAGQLSVEPLTVDQYEGMLAQGILEEGAPIELLDGLLVRKDRAAAGEEPMTVGVGHTLAMNKLVRLAPAFRTHGCYLAVQSPIRIPRENEPEPDGAVVIGAPEDHATRHPGPRDVSSVIEVSESSLLRDRTTKLRIYATAGIPQYVIVNLIDQRVEVYDSPLPKEGRYAGGSLKRAEEVVRISAGIRGRSVRAKARDLLPGRGRRTRRR